MVPGPPHARGNKVLSQAKADFSESYITALAAVARCTLKIDKPDIHGIDVQITAEYENVPDNFDYASIDVQLKCTQEENIHSVPVKLKKRQNNRLVGTAGTPRMLVAVHVPADSEDWLTFSPGQMVTRHAAYWRSAEHLSPTTQDEITIAVPKTQRLTVDELCRLLDLSRTQQPLGGS